MTVTEAKELFEWLESNGYGDYNIAVNDVRPNPYILTIGKYTWAELEEIITAHKKAKILKRLRKSVETLCEE